MQPAEANEQRQAQLSQQHNAVAQVVNGLFLYIFFFKLVVIIVRKQQPRPQS